MHSTPSPSFLEKRNHEHERIWWKEQWCLFLALLSGGLLCVAGGVMGGGFINFLSIHSNTFISLFGGIILVVLFFTTTFIASLVYLLIYLGIKRRE